MVYVFDIDGTICSQNASDYTTARPFPARIKKINNLYDEGNTIIFFTARGMGRHKNNPLLAIQDFYEFTATQLKSWGVKYHNLFLGKPNGDIYIDDKGMKDADFFTN